MKKYFLLVIFLFAGTVNLFADTIDLNFCYTIVYNNYPAAKQKPYYNSINKLKKEDIGINWLPQISLNGKVSYQSDVPSLNISSPFFNPPKINKDWYSLSLNVNQQIYDGGATSFQTEIEKNQVIIDNQKIDVDMFTLKQRVNDLYFSVLLLQEKKKVYIVSKEDVENRIKEMESRIKNGTIPGSNLYVLQAQLIQTEADIKNTEADIITSVNVLSKLLSYEINPSSDFAMPQEASVDFSNKSGNRPEYQLFEYQKNQISSYSNLIDSRILPKVGLYGQLGYGRPGQNYLDNTFQPFYLVGLNFQWNPVNWGKDNNERQIWEINKKIVDNQRETFDKNLQVTLEKYKNDAAKYEELIKKDDELVTIRKKIIESYASQVDNGVITPTSYVTELNNLTIVMLQKSSHQIQLLQAKVNYQTTNGN